MIMQSLKYPQEEFERRGQVWYETRVRSGVGRASGELADGDSGDGADGVAVICGIFGLSPTVCATGLTIAHRLKLQVKAVERGIFTIKAMSELRVNCLRQCRTS